MIRENKHIKNALKDGSVKATFYQVVIEQLMHVNRSKYTMKKDRLFLMVI